MATFNKFAHHVKDVGASLASVLRVVLWSKPVHFKQENTSDATLIILGNGPSLRTNINEDMDLLHSYDTLAVNFAANTPEFFELRPKYYVIADPHFFQNTDDRNVAALFESLQSVNWMMTLYVPAGSVKAVRRRFSNGHLKVAGFNMVAAEGISCISDALMNRALGMPRPRNVLIPSIMIGIWLGYTRIVLLGADHTWLQSLTVDDENRVVSVQRHFYKESPTELERITRVYDKRRLHEVLESMCIAFRSYHAIAGYAKKKHVTILNSTPASYIDAFPRKELHSALN